MRALSQRFVLGVNPVLQSSLSNSAAANSARETLLIIERLLMIRESRNHQKRLQKQMVRTELRVDMSNSIPRNFPFSPPLSADAVPCFQISSPGSLGCYPPVPHAFSRQEISAAGAFPVTYLARD